jgi:hypothetical protein
VTPEKINAQIAATKTLNRRFCEPTTKKIAIKLMNGFAIPQTWSALVDFLYSMVMADGPGIILMDLLGLAIGLGILAFWGIKALNKAIAEAEARAMAQAQAQAPAAREAAKDELGRIARRYGYGYCDAAAKAMAAELVRRQLHGFIITLRWENNRPLSKLSKV